MKYQSKRRQRDRIRQKGLDRTLASDLDRTEALQSNSSGIKISLNTRVSPVFKPQQPNVIKIEGQLYQVPQIDADGNIIPEY